MRHLPFTPEWAAAFLHAIEHDAAYAQAAAKWIWPIALVLEATPEHGHPEAVAVELALDRGRCHGAEIRAPETVTAPFVLTAPWDTWKSVVRGDMDPLAAVVRGQIKVQGPLATLMLQAKAAVALLECARAVPTRFPDDH